MKILASLLFASLAFSASFDARAQTKVTIENIRDIPAEQRREKYDQHRAKVNDVSYRRFEETSKEVPFNLYAASANDLNGALDYLRKWRADIEAILPDARKSDIYAKSIFLGGSNLELEKQTKELIENMDKKIEKIEGILKDK